MAHDTEIDGKITRIEELINQLEAGGMSVNEAEQLHQEGHQLLDDARAFIATGEGEGTVIERE